MIQDILKKYYWYKPGILYHAKDIHPENPTEYYANGIKIGPIFITLLKWKGPRYPINRN